jgi:hypothetical protein
MFDLEVTELTTLGSQKKIKEKNMEEFSKYSTEIIIILFFTELNLFNFIFFILLSTKYFIIEF